MFLRAYCLQRQGWDERGEVEAKKHVSAKQQTDDGMMHATLENTPILEHPLNIGKPIQLIVYLLHVSAASQTYGWKQLDRYPDCEASRNMA